MTYEQAIKELEEISIKLEDENIDIDQAVKLFEKSIELTKICFSKLKETDGKINILKKELDKLIETSFSTNV